MCSIMMLNTREASKRALCVDSFFGVASSITLMTISVATMPLDDSISFPDTLSKPGRTLQIGICTHELWTLCSCDKRVRPF